MGFMTPAKMQGGRFDLLKQVYGLTAEPAIEARFALFGPISSILC